MKTLSTLTIFAAIIIIGCNVETNSEKDAISLMDYWPSIAVFPFILIAAYTIIVIKNSKR